jgi:hypothetical protein
MVALVGLWGILYRPLVFIHPNIPLQGTEGVNEDKKIFKIKFWNLQLENKSKQEANFDIAPKELELTYLTEINGQTKSNCHHKNGNKRVFGKTKESTMAVL